MGEPPLSLDMPHRAPARLQIGTTGYLRAATITAGAGNRSGKRKALARYFALWSGVSIREPCLAEPAAKYDGHAAERCGLPIIA